MQKPTDPDDYELRDEVDLSKLAAVPKGRYAPYQRAGKNVILLALDVAEAFPTDEAVNEAFGWSYELPSSDQGSSGTGPGLS
jgi:hypothetical protein